MEEKEKEKEKEKEEPADIIGERLALQLLTVAINTQVLISSHFF